MCDGFDSLLRLSAATTEIASASALQLAVDALAHASVLLDVDVSPYCTSYIAMSSSACADVRNNPFRNAHVRFARYCGHESGCVWSICSRLFIAASAPRV